MIVDYNYRCRLLLWLLSSHVKDDRTPETNRSPGDIYLHHYVGITKRMATELGAVSHLSD